MTVRPPRRGALALALVAALGAALGAAFGHAYLEGAEPAARSVVAASPEGIAFHFSMDVEPRFSRLELYRLELPDGVRPEEGAASDPSTWQRIEALAATFAAEVRAAPAGAFAERAAEAGLREREAGRTLTLELHAPLGPGAWIVVWEVLATDGHATRNHHVFAVAGE